MSFCSISGNTCEDPVVSKTGYVFEKRLIEKHLAANGTCPVTGEPLVEGDLFKLNTAPSVKPRPVTATSIPGMLQLFQNEWDSLMLETATLRKHLLESREQLSNALYENDASSRVIARLIVERDMARKEMSELKAGKHVAAAQNGASAANDAMEVDQAGGFSAEIQDKMVACSTKLAAGRKGRKVAETVKSVEDIAKLAQASSHPIHKTSPAGIMSVAINPRNPNQTVTGGVDKAMVIFDRGTKKVVQSVTDHSKKVNFVAFHPTKDIIFSTSQDKTCKIWSQSNGSDYSVAHTLTGHEGDCVGATIHATGEYVVTASADKSWAFWDIGTGKMIDQVTGESPYTCVSFHPDGLILGAGSSDHTCSIFDVKTQKNVASFTGHTGDLTSLSFSENGYYLATAAKDSTVKIWDLRKLLNIKTINMDSKYPVNCVSWDASGSYLAAAGSDLQVFKAKSWDLLYTSNDTKVENTSCAFGPDASFIALASMDRALRIYSC